MSKYPVVRNLPHCVVPAAEILGVSENTVHHWVYRGKLEKLPVVGNAVLIPPKELRRRLREMAAEKEKTDV